MSIACDDETVSVSIHSRRLSREIRPGLSGRPGAAPGFNPLPAVKPGDTFPLAKSYDEVMVSIHSRRLSREIRIRPSIAVRKIPQFQSTPGG